MSDGVVLPVQNKANSDAVKNVLDKMDNASFSLYHVKIIIISGMGFFTDSYDLFCISLLTRMVGRIYFQDDPFYVNTPVNPGKLPLNLDVALSSVALCGTLAGQLLFGSLGDICGRKSVYGLTLAIMIFCAIAQSMSFGTTPNSVIGTLCFWRFLLGVGVGGDYPLSATIMSEYSSKLSRGAFISAVFAMQGIGILTAAAVTSIVAAIFHARYKSGDYPKTVHGCKNWQYKTAKNTTHAAIPCPTYLKEIYWQEIQDSCPTDMDHCWRLVLALGAIPAALTLYFREKMPETPRYTLHKEGNAAKMVSDMGEIAQAAGVEHMDTTKASAASHSTKNLVKEENDISFSQFLSRYGIQLLGCTMAWFLLDVAFYSQNLFQKDIFLQIGWLPPAIKMNAIQETLAVARAQALIALGSTIPGYYATVFTVDILGRLKIQLMGFVLMTVFMAALAGAYYTLLNPNEPHNTGASNSQPGKKNGWIAMYAFCFFFANFGPNATTFVIPAELFPTKWKSTGHGISAACGKAGAIIGAFGFLFAANPARREKTWTFPCYKPFDTYPGTDACKLKTNCPTGRSTYSTDTRFPQLCDYCLPRVKVQCYPFGLGVQGALGILAGTNFLGIWFTFLLPETMGKTLEELNGENVE